MGNVALAELNHLLGTEQQLSDHSQLICLVPAACESWHGPKAVLGRRLSGQLRFQSGLWFNLSVLCHPAELGDGHDLS